jgi:hypothetical protein
MHKNLVISQVVYKGLIYHRYESTMQGPKPTITWYKIRNGIGGPEIVSEIVDEGADHLEWQFNGINEDDTEN